MNPARSLAPCIVNKSFPTYHWIYWVGPTAGVILAVLVYKLVKALEYESVNGEDHDEMPSLPRLTGDSRPRKPSSIIVLPSSSPAASNTTAVPQVPQRPVLSIQQPAPATQQKKEESVLPECYAD